MSSTTTKYAAGGSPGWDDEGTETDYALASSIQTALKQDGHTGVHVALIGMGYKDSYMCAVYHLTGLEEGKDVVPLLREELRNGHVVPEGRGSAKIYIPRFRAQNPALGWTAFIILTVQVLALLSVLYLLLHYVDPDNFSVPEWADPF
jgi:hypothetical protein